MKRNSIIDNIAMQMMLPVDSLDGSSDKEIIHLIESVENINSTDRDGRTLLIHASTYHRIAVVDYLLSQNADINAQDKLGYTALHAAVNAQDYAITQLLLSRKANVKAVDKWGNTPLFRTSHLHPELIQLLLDNGADPQQSNNYGITAYQMYQAYPDILQMFDSIQTGG